MISTMFSGTVVPPCENPEERLLSARRCAQKRSSGWVAVDPGNLLIVPRLRPGDGDECAANGAARISLHASRPDRAGPAGSDSRRRPSRKTEARSLRWRRGGLGLVRSRSGVASRRRPRGPPLTRETRPGLAGRPQFLPAPAHYDSGPAEA